MRKKKGRGKKEMEKKEEFLSDSNPRLLNVSLAHNHLAILTCMYYPPHCVKYLV